jgi:lambda family phage portal protein
MVKKRRNPIPRPNAIDRIVGYFAPVAASKRMKARASMEVFAKYTGASKSRRGLSGWTLSGENGPDAEILELDELRERSRDLHRNNALARGAIETKITHAIGTGLVHHAGIDADFLGLSQKQADDLESHIEREFRLFWNRKNIDAARTLTGRAMTAQVYRGEKLNGDHIVLLPRIRRDDSPYSLRLQSIESDRLSNAKWAVDTDTLCGGVEKNNYGAPVAYHICDGHPGDYRTNKNTTWTRYPAYGRSTGLPNVIHFYNQERAGQTRGFPDLAPVIEPLKQLGRYSEAEIMAAVVQGLFTVFIETEGGGTDLDFTHTTDETGGKASDDDLKLGYGSVVGLADGEKISNANPARPNSNYDPFFQANVRQIGMGLQIPFEVLIKHFTASYSAARAAIIEFWRYIICERKHIVDDFLRIVYEVWFYEAVAIGRIAAPGFLNDIAIRQAYLGADWVGSAMPQIDVKKEVEAAALRVKNDFSTRQAETANLTGGNWESDHRQRVKEKTMREADGLAMEQGNVAERIQDPEQSK